MNIVDYLSSPWAIMPEKLLEIQAIYATHMRGEKIDIKGIEARIGRPLANEQQDYTVRDNGVAVLPISGVITNKANMFSRVSGMASAQILQQQVESLMNDSRVRAVVIDMDSPGGSVLGIPALATAIKALAAEKPTVTCCTGTMASAGYWVGSSSNAIYISGLTDYVGSIGVVATHSYDPKSGSAQTTEITAGKFKRMASDSKPLDSEGAAYIQAQVDEIYRVFVETVAENRGVSTDTVLKDMADGRIFIGQQAIDAGLVDGVSTVEAMVEKLGSSPEQFAARSAVNASVLDGGPVLQAASVEPTGVIQMSIEQIIATFEAEQPEAAAAIKAAGAASERDRIKAVREQSMPGHEALIEALAADGKTTGPEAAVQILAAEKSRIAGVKNQRDADAPAVVPTEASDKQEDAAPVEGGYKAPAGFAVDESRSKLDAAAKQYMNTHPGASYLDAVKAVS